VQLHSAHGYLLSSFLSPVTNRRTDAWGGSIENRARMLIETLRATRREVGADFPLGVKLNSDDFRKGGFSNEDCLRVVQMLNGEGVDLLEISGGTYEQPRLLGIEGRAGSAMDVKPSTRAREAYFLDYAEKIRAVAKMPLMVTGGFRSRAGMEAALAGACDVIGLGRPLVSDPDAARKLLAREIDELPADERRLAARQKPGKRAPYVAAFAGISWYYIQIFRLADGLQPDPALKPGMTLMRYLWAEQTTAWKMRGARRELERRVPEY
jgi:2,4-dienoyl-CoA reductase-like NADH-dependent reductase (Old Yellow Enzyme family)